MNDEIRYRLLKLLEHDPKISQRDLAQSLGISLGKTNYCLKALIEKGFVKARNFKNNPNKKGYLYILTSRGIEEKAKVGVAFLKRKVSEHEQLTELIEELREEIKDVN